MQRLIEGFHRFRREYYEGRRELYERLAAEGQNPRAMVIACADSRVDPQLLFQAAPGELFVLRNVANLVPPYQPDAGYHGASAALEFAVKALKVEDIIVLGHAHCGGVASLLAGPDAAPSDFIGPWMSIAASARALAAAAAKSEAARIGEHETVRISVRNLLTFPWIRERVAAGKLRVHGCWFDLATGELVELRI
jgi:carbonic anhydrase